MVWVPLVWVPLLWVPLISAPPSRLNLNVYGHRAVNSLVVRHAMTKGLLFVFKLLSLSTTFYLECDLQSRKNGKYSKHISNLKWNGFE